MCYINKREIILSKVVLSEKLCQPSPSGCFHQVVATMTHEPEDSAISEGRNSFSSSSSTETNVDKPRIDSEILEILQSFHCPGY